MSRRCCYLPPFPDSSPRFTGDGWILESRGKFSSFFLLPLFFLFFLSAHWILVGRDLFPISRTRIISLFSLSLSLLVLCVSVLFPPLSRECRIEQRRIMYGVVRDLRTVAQLPCSVPLKRQINFRQMGSGCSGEARSILEGLKKKKKKEEGNN